MAGAVVAPDFGAWSAPEHSLIIEYSAAVLDEIRLEAVDGYLRVPHGGVETGGILFGAHDNNTVRILAWRPIACEYSNGPSFLLSEKDEASLAATLQSFRDHPLLTHLEPVGWVHSHTRSEIFLTDADLSLFERFFPQLWQVALVLHPGSLVPTRAGFFFREPDGSIHSANSYHEFVLEPFRGDAAAPEPEAAEPVVAAAPVVPAEPAEPPKLPEAPPLPISEMPRPQPRQLFDRGWLAMSAATALLVCLAVAMVLWLRKPAPSGIELSAADANGQLRISWDRAAPAIQHAAGASLLIEDQGVSTRLKLSPADLRLGSISYARQSGDVMVRLTIESRGRPALEEVTRFLRPSENRPAPAQPPALSPPDASKQALQQESEAIEARIAQQKTELTQLEKKIGDLHQTQSARALAPLKPAAPAPTSQPAAVPPPPLVQQAPVQTSPLPLTQPAPTPVPPPTPAPEVQRAAPAPPASGRIIWTGKIPKNGGVTIVGGHASAGALSAALPSARSARRRLPWRPHRPRPGSLHARRQI